MNLASNPLDGLAGGFAGARAGCSIRRDPSDLDPATFEDFVDLMRQGSAGLHWVPCVVWGFDLTTS